MKFNPYSHSKIGTYLQCPMKFKLKYKDKIKVPFTKNKSLYRGSFAHLIIENNYDYETPFECNEIFTEEDKIDAIEMVKAFESSELGQYYKDKNDNYKSAHELEFGFKIQDGTIVSCGYWDKEAWQRGKIDFAFFTPDNILYLIDWKSGKFKEPEYQDDSQTKMYAVWGFAKYPEINEIKASFVYVEHGKENKFTYKREDLTSLIKEFYVKTKTCENDTTDRKVSGPLCDYCDYFDLGYCDGKEEPFEISTGLDF